MSRITLSKSAVDKLMSDPKIRQWRQHKSSCKVPFLGYYRRSYSTSHDGTVTEHGDGFMLKIIDPHDRDETRDIVIKPVALRSDFDILVGGDAATMSESFSIGCSRGKFTIERENPS